MTSRIRLLTTLTVLTGLLAVASLSHDIYKSYKRNKLRSEIKSNVEYIIHTTGQEEARKAREHLEIQMKELQRYE